jgi:hypothetical protein
VLCFAECVLSLRERLPRVIGDPFGAVKTAADSSLCL